MTQSTRRFSDRVTNYVRYRPSYPQTLVDTLISYCKLSDQSVIADIGSGPGTFSELLLNRHYRVTGVEPNKEMRETAEHQYSAKSNFSSVDGTSESTGLKDCSVDLITAAQAFHWFDLKKTREEFNRILKPDGSIAVIWNQRDLSRPLQIEYDQMLRQHAAEYNRVNHMNITDDNVADFFSPGRVEKQVFPNAQQFDLDGFLGRINSASYTPKQNTAEYQDLEVVARRLFNKYKENETIVFEYQTSLYIGSFNE